MARTDDQRYTGALDYIEKNISRELATEIKSVLGTTNPNVGKALSLGGAGYWRSGSDAQHWAVRSLLLCQQAFLLGPNAHPFVRASSTNAATKAKTYFHGKAESIIQEAIRSYTREGTATLADLADTATNTTGTAGDFVFATRRRADQSLGANPVCFNAVRLWLFNAGIVSLKWLASDGYGLDANTCNRILGDGEVISLADLPRMRRGYMFNFHAKLSKPTCHWGISLGDGWAAGSNTTENYAGAAQPVAFRKGNSIYGEFEMTRSYEVCKYKYQISGRAVEDIVIRKIDPMAVTTYF